MVRWRSTRKNRFKTNYSFSKHGKTEVYTHKRAFPLCCQPWRQTKIIKTWQPRHLPEVALGGYAEIPNLSKGKAVNPHAEPESNAYSDFMHYNYGRPGQRVYPHTDGSAAAV